MSMNSLEVAAQRGLAPPVRLVLAMGGEASQTTFEASEPRIRAVMAALGQSSWESASASVPGRDARGRAYPPRNTGA